MHPKLDEITIEHFRIYNLNKKLLGVLHNIGFDLLNFADKYNYPIPSNLKNYLDETEKLMTELEYPTIINKKCFVCNKLNPDNADFCCYCGSSLIINQVSPDLLHPKNKDSNHPNSDRTDSTEYLYIIPFIIYNNNIENYWGLLTYPNITFIKIKINLEKKAIVISS